MTTSAPKSTSRKQLEVKGKNSICPVTHPFIVIPGEEDGYEIVFPDLPGCFGQCAELAQVPGVASEAWMGWMLTAMDRGYSVPEPTNVKRSLSRLGTT